MKVVSDVHIKILPKENWLDLKLKEVWGYRELVMLLARTNFVMSYQQTVLGPFWVVIQPVLSTLLYLFVFGYIARIDTGDTPQVLFYLVSTSVWGIFSSSLMGNANVFQQNVHLFTKVYFPRLTVPLGNMLVSLWRFAVQLAIVAVMMVVYIHEGAIQPRWECCVMLPLLFLQMAFFGMSMGILFSALTGKYRDISMLVPSFVNVWMYASAVLYPVSILPEGMFKTLILLNPLTEIMELMRLILFGAGHFDLLYWLSGVAISLLVFLGSTLLFNRMERNFADTV